VKTLLRWWLRIVLLINFLFRFLMFYIRTIFKINYVVCAMTDSISAMTFSWILLNTIIILVTQSLSSVVMLSYIAWNISVHNAENRVNARHENNIILQAWKIHVICIILYEMCAYHALLRFLSRGPLPILGNFVKWILILLDYIDIISI